MTSLLRPFLNLLPASWLVVVALTTPAAAEQLFRWTDQEGRVHFSDRAPPADAASGSLEQLTTPDYVDPGTPPGHFSVIQQWQRMSAERQAQERSRQERKDRAHELALRQREVAAAERAAEQAANQSSYSGPVWIAPRYYRRRPGIRPPITYPPPGSQGLWKRDHPAFRPYPAPRAPGSRPNVEARVHRH